MFFDGTKGTKHSLITMLSEMPAVLKREGRFQHQNQLSK